MVTGRVHRMTELFGRLAPGATLESAHAELKAVSRARWRRNTRSPIRRSAKGVVDADAAARSDHGAGADGAARAARRRRRFVFVIACSNVANLILARSVRREGELAVRAALGASTGALRRTLLAESLLLCGAGAVLGVAARAAAWWRCSRAMRRASRCARSTSPWTPACCGSASAWRSRRPCCWRSCRACRRRRAERLRPGERRRPHHARHQPPPARVRGDADRASFVLLAGAGMLSRRWSPCRRARTGFDTRHVLAIDVPVDRRAGARRQQIARLLRGERAPHRRAAGRRARGAGQRWCRGGTPAISAPASSSRSRAHAGRRRGEIRARGSAPSRPASSPRWACRSSPAATSTRGRPRRQREGRDRQPERGAADVSEPATRSTGTCSWTDPIMKFIDVSTRAAAHRRHRRPTWTTRTSCRGRR